MVANSDFYFFKFFILKKIPSASSQRNIDKNEITSIRGVVVCLEFIKKR